MTRSLLPWNNRPNRTAWYVRSSARPRTRTMVARSDDAGNEGAGAENGDRIPKIKGPFSARRSEQLGHRLTVRNAHGPPKGVGHLGPWVDAEAVVHGGGDVGRREDAAADGKGAGPVGLAVEVARPDAAARQKERVTVGPVIAAGLG